MLTTGLTVAAAQPADAVVSRQCIGTKLSTHVLKDSGGRALGRVELWYKQAGGIAFNCVQTISYQRGNKVQELGAYLAVGTTGKRSTVKTANGDLDVGLYRYYAGGVWLPAAHKCVRYAGSVRVCINGKLHTAKWKSAWNWCG